MDVDLLRIAGACACSMTVAPSKTKHSNADLGVLAARTLQNGDAHWSYYKMLIFQNLSSREQTKKMYENETVRVVLAVF